MEIKKTIQKEKKKKKEKCLICKKKLILLDIPCSKCNICYCIKHRLPESHNCFFNFKKEGKILLQKNNPKIINEKIIKI